MFQTKIFFLIALLACIEQARSLSCKDENGQDVDWYVLLKPPKQKNDNPSIAAGGGYGFITNKSKASGWQLGAKDISDIKSFPGQTFAEVYKNPQSFSYVHYNDAKPEGMGTDSSSYAHAKGVLVWNNKDAVWMVHSAPKFLPPFSDKKYDYPETARIHGQNFLCMTLDTKGNVDQILNHLVTMKAQVYATNLSNSLDKTMVAQIQENINILDKKIKSNKGEPKQGTLTKVNDVRIKELTRTVKTKGGESFTVIAKSRKDNVDIWSAIAAPALKAKEFAVKYWTLLQKAAALLGSTCARQKVINVMDMDIKFTNAPDVELDWGRNDHSKWGLCTNGDDLCYCAGDMNRATSQFTRGGGVVCMFNKQVHDTFQKSYSTQFSCNNKLEKNPKR